MIAFTDRGGGPAVTFLHGFALDGRMWSAAARALEGTHRVVVMDLPGFGPQGSSEASDAPALAVLGVLDELGIERTHLVGHSFGGAVAVDLALARPDRVASLGLVDALLLGAPTAIGSRTACTVAALAGRCEEARRAWLDDPLFDGVRARPHVFAEAERMARDYACGHWTGDVSIRWLVAAPMDRLGELAMPALVMHGADDTAAFVAMSKIYEERLPRARRIVLPEAGHLSSMEAPDAFLEALRAFLADV